MYPRDHVLILVVMKNKTFTCFGAFQPIKNLVA